MKIKILGCYGNVSDNYRATSFFVNDSILIDAGTTTEVLDANQVSRIEDVVVSHTHIDHIKGIFSLIDQLVMMNSKGIRLSSVSRVLEIISQNLFNNLVWPDFTMIPSVNDAILTLNELGLEEKSELNGLEVKPVLMDHSVYTVGYAVKERGKGFMFTSDTGPTSRFWELAAEEEGIEFIIADVSFPNRLEKLARISGHMTLSILLGQLAKFRLEGMPIYISHMKPIFLDEIVKEVELLGGTNIRLLEQGSTIEV